LGGFLLDAGFWCQVPANPAKAKRNQSTIADEFQCH